VPHQADGTLALDDIAAAIHGGDDPHVAETRLLALENTLGGRVMPLSWLAEATALAREHRLSAHLDGARVFNAAVAGNVDVAEIARPFDTISVCLSKGLGAPVGTVLVGETELIAKARRLRKAVGGGMRQAGILAAAGLYALEHNIARLAEDHANARLIADRLRQSTAIDLDPATVQTNILVFRAAEAPRVVQRAREQGVLVSAFSPRMIRAVTHLDVTRAECARAAEVLVAAAEKMGG
jgi:threonine aldolase